MAQQEDELTLPKTFAGAIKSMDFVRYFLECAKAEFNEENWIFLLATFAYQNTFGVPIDNMPWAEFPLNKFNKKNYDFANWLNGKFYGVLLKVDNKTRQEWFVIIFDKWISLDAPISINISGELKNLLTQVKTDVDDQKKSDQDIDDLWQRPDGLIYKAQVETFNLLTSVYNRWTALCVKNKVEFSIWSRHFQNLKPLEPIQIAYLDEIVAVRLKDDEKLKAAKITQKLIQGGSL